MPTSVFVNLPVKDLKNSMLFYEALGFAHNPQFTDESAACIVVSDTIYVMLLTQAKFKEFTPKEIADPSKVCGVLLSLSCESRSGIDDMVAKAINAGGSKAHDPVDYGLARIWHAGAANRVTDPSSTTSNFPRQIKASKTQVVHSDLSHFATSGRISWVYSSSILREAVRPFFRIQPS